MNGYEIFALSFVAKSELILTQLSVTVADPEGDPGLHRKTPALWGAPSTKKYTDVWINGISPPSGYRTKKTAAMAHLRMLYKKFV